MANHVINCFGNELQRKALEKWLVDDARKGQFADNSDAQMMLKFMTGKLLEGPYNCSWMQALCYNLMVVSHNTDTLVDVIKAFDVYMRAKHPGDKQPLLWLLIKYYGVEDPEVLKKTLKQLQTFSEVSVYPR